MHADVVIRQYVDSVRERYGQERASTIKATFDAGSGWYYVNDKAMRETALTDATRFMYASAHEMKLGEQA